MKVWRMLKEETPYLLIVHQQNLLVTKVFDATLKVRESHTGNLNLSGSNFKNTFTGLCPQNQDVSKLVTGFSVEVDTGKKTYIVCGDSVLVHEGTQDYLSGSNAQFTKKSIADACRDDHPVFCPPEKNDYPLISIAVIPTKKNDKNPYIYGYYAEKRQTEDRETREYVVKAWRWNNKANRDYETKLYGYLAEIDTFGETDTEMLGLYFTVDGNACFFKQTYSETPNLDIEDRSVPRKPCLSFQVFIGCPTPWCFDIKIDASFSYTDKANIFQVFFFKGFFYWIFEDIGLPFVVPSYKNAYKLFNVAENSEKKMCLRFTGDDHAPVCLSPSVNAAFGADIAGQQIIYIKDSDFGSSSINRVWEKNDHFDDKDVITGNNTPNIQAALFDQDSQTAFLFFPNEYKAFKYETKDKWNLVSDNSGKLQDLNIEFNEVDAGVNLRDNKAYIFSNNWYYEVTFAEGKLQVDSKRLVGIDKFFDVRRECYYNSQDEFFELLSRYERKKMTAEDLMVNVTARPVFQQDSPKGRYTAVYIILIVLIGVAIVCAAWVAMFLYDRKAKSVQVVKRGKGEKAGKTDSKMATELKGKSNVSN